MKHRRYRRGVLVVANKKRDPLRFDPSRTGLLRRSFVARLMKSFALLRYAVRQLVVKEDAFGLKAATAQPLVGNASVGGEHYGTLDWAERRQLGIVRLPGRLIELQNIRQPNHFFCGASATFSVTSYFGVGARTQEETARILGTSVERSTHPEAIAGYLRSLGLQVEARFGLTLDDLSAYHRRGWPVICPVQDYNDRREPGALWDYGHYLCVIGRGFGYVFCQDSSIDNYKRIPAGDVPKHQEQEPDLSAPGRIMVRERDWLDNWHDVDQDGNRYVRFGIAVGPPLVGNAVPKECPLDPAECDEEEEVEGSATVEKRIGVKARSIILDNTRWRFHTDPAKLKAFQAWLKAQFGKDLTSPDAEELWRKYAEEGFKKGAARAFDDTRRAQKALAAGDQQKLDFYEGTRDEFLRSSFARPVAVEKIQLLAARSFAELDGVTDAMEQRMTRVLADGLVQGKGTAEIARDLDDELDIGRQRAETIARTEIIRAHAEGQLQALEDLGVEEVGVAVEFTVTEDEKLCPRCEALSGVVLKIEEARGLIPVHPNCRCAFIPANVGESEEGQKDTKKEIDAAAAEADVDLDVSRRRPQSILNQLRQLLGNEAMLVPEQEEGTPETDRDVRRRAKKGKIIGMPPRDVSEDVIKDQPGQEPLEEREDKARRDEEAPPRNR
jgi:SPP1 gp7 family putative phage head morphogenesis protein